MSATLFGVVIRETSGKPGWYDVGCSQFAGEVSGVSIKGTSLTAGQRVAVIQSGGWSDQRKTFGFAEANAGLLSVVEATITKNWLLDTNPVNGALHYIFSKAGKAQEIYRPAIVTAVGSTTLTVKDWYADEALGAWPVVSGLSASDFEIGNGVLLRLIPNALRQVEGWWETEPGMSPFMVPGVSLINLITTVGFGVLGYDYPSDTQVSPIWEPEVAPANLIVSVDASWNVTLAVATSEYTYTGSSPMPSRILSVDRMPSSKFNYIADRSAGYSFAHSGEVGILFSKAFTTVQNESNSLPPGKFGGY